MYTSNTETSAGDSPEILYLNFNDSDTMGEKIRATYILDAGRIAS